MAASGHNVSGEDIGVRRLSELVPANDGGPRHWQHDDGEQSRADHARRYVQDPKQVLTLQERAQQG